MISRGKLKNLYINRKKSAEEIAKTLACSPRTVRYWMSKYNIPTRTISEAIYIKHNPDGDPFKFKKPRTLDEAQLFGLGLGLYWGEGTKADAHSVRLGNTDPDLIRTFMNFLIRAFGLKKEDFKFWLQIFSDIDTNEALKFWIRKLRIKPRQITKPTITRSGSLGTYRKKSKYGVITVYYHNTKLRKLIGDMLATVAQR